MHKKSNRKIGYRQREFSPAVMDVCPQLSTSLCRPWCQGHGDVLGGGHTSTTAHDRAGAARRHGLGNKTMIVFAQTTFAGLIQFDVGLRRNKSNAQK